MRSLTRHETPAADQVDALRFVFVPARYEEAAHWVARLLAHFPRRDSVKDAIVISDIAGDLVEAEISLVAVASVCDDLRKEATNENPFMPPSGEVLQRAKDKMKTFDYMRRRLVPALEAPR